MIVLMNQVLSCSSVLSGGEKITVELLRRWKRLSDILLIMPENGLKRIKDGEGLDVEYDTLPLLFMDKGQLYWRYIFLVPLAWFIHARNCWKKISALEIKDKLMYASGDFFCNIVPAFLKKSKQGDIKWIVSIFHIIDSPFRRKGGHSFLSNLFSKTLQKFSFLLIKKKADLIFVLNEDLKENLTRQGFRRERMHVLGAGIDFERIRAVPEQNFRKYDACFMARLSTTKGIADIPRIWAYVTKNIKTARLLVIGEGLKTDVEKLKQSISEFGLEKQIDLVGAKIGQEKYRLMKTAKLFIFPSYEEGFAISILEALACKMPVIAWDLPVYKAIYGKRISMVSKADLETFGAQVVKLLNDHKMREAMALDGFNFAQEYDWGLIARKGYQIITGVRS